MCSALKGEVFLSLFHIAKTSRQSPISALPVIKSEKGPGSETTEGGCAVNRQGL